MNTNRWKEFLKESEEWDPDDQSFDEFWDDAEWRRDPPGNEDVTKQLSTTRPGRPPHPAEDLPEELTETEKNNDHWIGESPGSVEFFRRVDAYDFLRNVKKIVQDNEILGQVKIINFLGAGSFGAVYALDNDHALKLYIGSFDPRSDNFDAEAKSDRQRYQEETEEIYSGEGKQTNLMIYEEGELKLPSWISHKVFYAEMPQLIPLGDYLEFEVDQRAKKHDYSSEDVEGLKDNLWMQVEGDIRAYQVFSYLEQLLEKHPDDTAAKLYTRMIQQIIGDEYWGAALNPTFLKQLFQFFVLLIQEGHISIEEYLIGRAHLFNKEMALSLYRQIRKVVREKGPAAVADVRIANIGLLKQNLSVPILFDY